MRVGIMQPYLFPYLGYFHLIDAVDILVVLDDVNYPKGGWVNRNRILVDGKASWLTIPVSAAGRIISHKSYVLDSRHFSKIQRKVSQAYARSVRLDEFQSSLCQWFGSQEKGVLATNVFFIQNILDSLGRKSPKFIYSSAIELEEARGQNRILSLCSSMGAKTYINLSGGRHLYNTEEFRSRGIDLKFVQSAFPEYHQRSANFLPQMSVVDFFLSEDRESSPWLGSDSYKLIP